ncbi:hypothetical protein ZHAS_00020627 [Anopheles sinensis]|uniref:Uncharacterized protein n=1 Tax=Anopheles sinensis TaxID=74873 RepID=A0A084WQ98_ANOSI|nr:hypothetical protein ZHAS_00020627 [Anopheles sinensis]
MRGRQRTAFASAEESSCQSCTLVHNLPEPLAHMAAVGSAMKMVKFSWCVALRYRDGVPCPQRKKLWTATGRR